MKAKKLAAVALSLCLTVPMFSTIVSAADGSLMFSDPQTKVGEEVSVDLVVRSGNSAVGDADITMSYDTSALQFESGEGVTADSDGKLTYSGSGDGTAKELRTTMTFKALKMGDTTITVDSSKAYLYSDETLTLDQGSSAIKIGQADDGSTEIEANGSESTGAATDITVNVNGTDYNFSEEFATSAIPVGYSETTKTFNGEEHKFVANEAGVTLGYLVDASGEGKFFLYNEDDSTFVPYTELKISDTTSIILLADNGGAKLPDSYQEGELTVADQTYPYWANPENDRYDLLYAVNTRTGEKGFYQYDSQDGTYQSVDVQTTDSTKKEAKGIVGKLESLVKEHPIVLLAGGALIVVVLLVLMIMFAVKLVHRNQELDDLYDEYDIPFEDEEDEEDDEPVTAKKSDRKAFGRKKVKDDDYDDGYDDDFNDDYDAFDEEYADYDFDDDYDDDYDDEYDAPTGNTRNIGRSAKKSKKGRKSDDYDVDFIDL